MAKAYLEPAEIETLEEAAQYLRDRLLIRLLFHLGCRGSPEIIGHCAPGDSAAPRYFSLADAAV